MKLIIQVFLRGVIEHGSEPITPAKPIIRRFCINYSSLTDAGSPVLNVDHQELSEISYFYIKQQFLPMKEKLIRFFSTPLYIDMIYMVVEASRFRTDIRKAASSDRAGYRITLLKAIFAKQGCFAYIWKQEEKRGDASADMQELPFLCYLFYHSHLFDRYR